MFKYQLGKKGPRGTVYINSMSGTEKKRGKQSS